MRATLTIAAFALSLLLPSAATASEFRLLSGSASLFSFNFNFNFHIMPGAPGSPAEAENSPFNITYEETRSHFFLNFSTNKNFDFSNDDLQIFDLVFSSTLWEPSVQVQFQEDDQSIGDDPDNLRIAKVEVLHHIGPHDVLVDRDPSERYTYFGGLIRGADLLNDPSRFTLPNQCVEHPPGAPPNTPHWDCYKNGVLQIGVNVVEGGSAKGSITFFDFRLEADHVSELPEPATVTLLLTGLAAAFARKRFALRVIRGLRERNHLEDPSGP